MTKERELKEAVREGRDRVSKVSVLGLARISLVIHLSVLEERR